MDKVETDVRSYADGKADDIGPGSYSSEDYKIYTTTITSWIEDGDLYYSDIAHNLDTDKIFIECYKDNDVISPGRIEIINTNEIRVYFTTNDDVKITILYREV